MAVLKVYGLSVEDLNILKAHAQAAIGEPNLSKFVKYELQDLLDKPAETANTQHLLASKQRLEVKLASHDYAKLKNLAIQSCMSANSFTVLLIQKFLYQHTPLTNDLIEILRQSNYQLLRIGRNLNQIARQLNIGEEVDLTSQKIDALNDIIDKHTEVVGQVLQVNRRRFE